MALERKYGSRGRKMVKEMDRGTREERQHDFFHGMDESQAADFDRQWDTEVKGRLPRHSRGLENIGNVRRGALGDR